MLATSENNEIHNLNSEPGSKPNAIPGFSTSVMCKILLIKGMLSPMLKPEFTGSKKGITNPFI